MPIVPWNRAVREALVLSTCLGGAIGGCDSATDPALPDVTHWVTGSALQSLDASGHFVLSKVGIPADQPVIDEGRALELAVAYLRTVGGNSALIAQLQSERRGGPVNIDRLKASNRVEAALSAYETTPPEYGAATLRSRGSAFIVRFLEDDEPVISVAVAAHATDVTIVDGKLQFPADFGNEFAIAGDPIGQGFETPISPERATQIAAEATGAKIDRQPLLRRPEWLFSVFYSRWLLHFDTPVRFRRAGTDVEVESTSVYVGDPLSSTAVEPPTLLLPRETQPETQQVSSGVQLRVRPGFPVWFDRVTVVR